MGKNEKNIKKTEITENVERKLIVGQERLLIKNKYHIMHMPCNKEKLVMIEAYTEFISFYRKLVMGYKPRSNRVSLDKVTIDDEFLGRYVDCAIRDVKKDLDNIADGSLNLYRKFSNIIDNFHKEYFYSAGYYSKFKVNHNQMLNLIREFFKTLGDDVLNMYDRLYDSNQLIISPLDDYTCGITYNNAPLNDPGIVLMNSENDFLFYMTIIHEIGHCYQDYLLRNQRNFSVLSPYSELTSHLFEFLFFDYLKNIFGEYYNMDYEKEFYDVYLNMISSSKVVCQLIRNNHIRELHPFSLDYKCCISPERRNELMLDGCGYIIREKEIIEKPVEPKEFKDREEYLEWQKKVDEIKYKEESGPDNQSSVDISDIQYAIGQSLAICFREKFKNNFNEEWKKYKDFICTINYLPLDEVINEYMDTNLINKKFSGFIKSYRAR